MDERRPTDQDARMIAEQYFARPVPHLTRFSMGGSHYTYEASDANNRRVVIRIATDAKKLDGFLYWYGHLKPKDISLPTLLKCETNPGPSGFPYLILERLEGCDLEAVYPMLTVPEKRALASHMVAIQDRVGTLPPAPGFGYARSYADASLHATWADVLVADLERSRRRIRETGAFDVRQVDRVAAKLPAYRSYFERVLPQAFLDDTTTINVLIADGKLSGIIDIDFVCFGDRLLTPALTRMALLDKGYETDYYDYWCEMLAVIGEQRQVLSLYASLFCVNFMGEVGQRFTRDVAPPIDLNKVAQLNTLLVALLAEC